MSDLLTNISTFMSNVGGWFSNLGSNIGSWFSNLGSTISNLLSYLNPFNENFFGYKIIQLLQNLFTYLFAPNEQNIQNNVNSIKSKFGFIEEIQEAIEPIQDIIETPDNQTSLSIDIPENTTGISRLKIIDLSWYEPYKPYGDVIITAFVYIFFIWRVYVNLPNIVSGVGGFSSDIVNSNIDLSKGGKK